MLQGLTALFTDTDPLTRAARGSSAPKFANLFAESDVTFLSLPERFEDGIDPAISQDELLALIRSSAQDLSGRSTFDLFRYKENGRIVLPLFTKREFGEEFAKRWAGRFKRIFPFDLLVVNGRAVIHGINEDDEVILNVDTKFQVTLTCEQIESLKSV